MSERSSRRRYLSVWLPFLPADRLGLNRPADPSSGEPRPLVFVEKIKGASRIARAGRRAIADGLQPGMTLADARARVPALRAVAFDQAADDAYLTHLAGLCLSFTPSLALEAPDGLVLDITGCAHLFDGERGLVQRLQMALSKAGISVANAAVAPTPEMARALARYGAAHCDRVPLGAAAKAKKNAHPIIVHGTGHDARLVRMLPVSALECSAEDALALRRAGLKTIGAIADRPSVLFSARFTQGFTTKLSRILGEEDRRIVPLVAPPSYLLDHRCLEPVVTAEAISQILEELTQRAAVQLREHGEGGRVFEAVFLRTDGCVRRIRVETGHATRDAAVVSRLYRDRLEALADPLDPGFGFDVIRLHVARTEPYDARQTSLDARDERQEQFSVLIDRLGAIFGSERVLRLHRAGTHIPEQAQIVAPASRTRAAPFSGKAGRGEAGWGEAGSGFGPSRPLHLFDKPHTVEMHGCPAHGGPGRFRWRRGTHEIAHAEGPERIAQAWWGSQSGYGTRDYYRVETEQGRRFWMFKADSTETRDTPRWFLHGVFA